MGLSSKEITELSAAMAAQLVGTDERGGLLAEAVRKQVAEQVAPQITDMADDIGELREALKAAPPGTQKMLEDNAPWNTGAHTLGVPDANWYNAEADGAKLDGKFANFKEFLTTVFKRDLRGIADDRLADIAETGSAKSEDLTGEELNLGGALVPEQFRPRLMSMQLQENSIRRRATVLPMQAPSVIIPALRDTDHSDGTVYGGVRFHWLETGKPIPASRAEFRTVTLQARSLAALMDIPNVLISDSFITVPSLVQRFFMEGVPWVEEGVFMRGDDVAKPSGIIGHKAAIKVSRENANQFSLTDAATMLSHLPPGSRGRAMWMINPEMLEEVITMTNGNMQAWMPDLSRATPGTFLGLPYTISEHASKKGSNGDICLVDWSYYVIGDRQALSMDASKENKFAENAILFRAISRLDGRPWIEEPLKPAQGSTNFRLSPFVTLN